MEGNNETGTQPPAQVEGQPTASQNDGQSGIEKRIGELTARLYEKDAQIQQLVQNVAQMSTRNQPETKQPESKDPFAGVDWTDVTAVQGAFTSAIEQQGQRLESKFTAQMNAYGARMAGGEVVQMAAQNGVQDAVVVQRAQALAQHWKQNGMPGTTQDALSFALGEAAMGKLPGAGQNRGQQGRFSPANAMTVGGTPAPYNPPQQTELPSNFDDLSPDQQMTLLEKRMGNRGF